MRLERYPVKKKESPKCFKPDGKTDTDSPRLRIEKSGRGTGETEKAGSGNAEKEAPQGRIKRKNLRVEEKRKIFKIPLHLTQLVVSLKFLKILATKITYFTKTLQTVNDLLTVIFLQYYSG